MKLTLQITEEREERTSPYAHAETKTVVVDVASIDYSGTRNMIAATLRSLAGEIEVSTRDATPF